MYMEFSNFVVNLKYMGIGMLGIFCVMGLIILVTVALNAIMHDKPSDDEQQK